MNEDQIYYLTKKWFINKGFLPLAGQPPNGCDHIPTIEIKDSKNLSKGSKGSYKPDIVFGKEDFLIIVECKPKFSKLDLNKLLEIDGNFDRKKMLHTELCSRGLFDDARLKHNFLDLETTIQKLRYCLSFSGPVQKQEKVASLVFTHCDCLGNLWLPTLKNYCF